MDPRTINPNDRPLGITDSIKLLTDVIILSKYFLIKPLHDSNVPSNAADELCGFLLNLESDLKDQKQIVKKENCAKKFLTLAKADLFPERITEEDRQFLHSEHFPTLQPGEHVAFLLEQKKLEHYIETYTKKKYQSELKELFHRACQLCVIGFSSYNLLQDRRRHDKEMQLSSPHDAKDILSSEKNKISRLVATLAKSKKTSTKAGDIASTQIEIVSDIEHLREKFNAIEVELLKKKNHELTMQSEIFLQYIKRKTDAIDERKEAKVIENLLTETKLLDHRLNTAEKRLQAVHNIHRQELKKQEAFYEKKIHDEKLITTPRQITYSREHLIFPAIFFAAGILLTVSGVGSFLGLAILTAGFAAMFLTLGVGTTASAAIFGHWLYQQCQTPAQDLTPLLKMSVFKKEASQKLDLEKGAGLSLSGKS